MFFVNHFVKKIILIFFHFFVDIRGQKRYYTSCVQEWRNWQTRRLQVPVAAMSCGFKSHLLHHEKLGFIGLFYVLRLIFSSR